MPGVHVGDDLFKVRIEIAGHLGKAADVQVHVTDRQRALDLDASQSRDVFLHRVIKLEQALVGELAEQDGTEELRGRSRLGGRAGGEGVILVGPGVLGAIGFVEEDHAMADGYEVEADAGFLEPGLADGVDVVDSGVFHAGLGEGSFMNNGRRGDAQQRFGADEGVGIELVIAIEAALEGDPPLALEAHHGVLGQGLAGLFELSEVEEDGGVGSLESRFLCLLGGLGGRAGEEASEAGVFGEVGEDLFVHTGRLQGGGAGDGALGLGLAA